MIVGVIKDNLRKGFSLIELMVAMGILSVLMLLLTVLLDQVQQSWQYSESRVSQFREARVAFDLVTKNLSQASLNTYWDLLDEDEDGLVDEYFRTSELHFIALNAGLQIPASGGQTPVGHGVFFQAPLGFSTNYRNLNNLYNGRGYFVAWGGDKAFRPSFIDGDERFRYRLMEFRPPAEFNLIFWDGQEERDRGLPQDFSDWFKQTGGGIDSGGGFAAHLNPLAENIVYLVISPRDTLSEEFRNRDETYSDIAPRYTFDSNDQSSEFESFSQQVPPLMRITMIAIDEGSAVRMEDGSQEPAEVKATLRGLFENTANFTEDIQTVSDEFNEAGINHKIFSSTIMLRSSQWSGEQ